MKTTTQLRITSESYKKIKVISKQKERSVNGQIVYILEQFIHDYEKINGKIDIELED